MVNLLIVLIPLAAWSGWQLALRHESRQARQHALRNVYLEGLNALLHDQTDEALERFIHLSTLDQQTLDTQLTLAALFRKRGELDRALHLHQQLLEYPLKREQRTHVELELAQDYAQVGMYREAVVLYEAHLRLLSDQDSARQRSLLSALLPLYERLGQWQAAIQLLHAHPHHHERERIAHYHSELAHIALQQQQYDNAQQHVQSALQHDPNHIRAHWLRAELALHSHEPINAIHDLQHIADHTPAFLPELLPLLERAYAALEQTAAYHRWLLSQEERYPNPRLTLAVAQSLHPHMPEAVQALLTRRLQEKHSPLLLSAYWQYSIHDTDPNLLQWLGQSLQPKTLYQCSQCGFRQQKLRWYCPSCRSWHGYQPLLSLHQEYKSNR